MTSKKQSHGQKKANSKRKSKVAAPSAPKSKAKAASGQNKGPKFTPAEIERIVDEVAGRPPRRPALKSPEEPLQPVDKKKKTPSPKTQIKKHLDAETAEAHKEHGAGAHSTTLEPINPASLVLPPELDSLSMPELIFCEEMLAHGNGTTAAQKAGYCIDNPASAANQATKLMKKGEIQGYMRARKASLVRHRGLTVETLCDMLLETYGKASVAVPVMEFDHAEKRMVETGEYTFDGRTAVASVLAIARLKGYDKGKDDGRKQRAFNIAIILGKYSQGDAAKVIDHAEIAPPPAGALPAVHGFPRIRTKPRAPGGGNGENSAG